MPSDNHAPAACTALAVTAVPAVLGGKHDSRIARRRGSTGPNAREPRGSCGVPGGGRPPDLARPSLHDTLAAQNKDTSLMPEQPLQLTTLVEYAQSTVSVRDEQATAATRRDWYRADPRAYIRIAEVLRERITAGETRIRSCTVLDHPPLRGPRRGPPDRSSRPACPSGCRARIPGPRTRLPRLQ